ncbi:MAG: dihydroorotate dehydrogenase electron transfer subunit [Clostridia bacterium]|nr:dihydroorotate dehydrogenase electron transfer subunit [Clostridia bacterium]
MKQSVFKILENEKIAADVFKMTLSGDISEITAPGQFVNIKLNGFYLRRPISVCDAQDGVLTLIYKTVGGGTEKMSALGAGAELDLLTGLGNGFDTDRAGDTPLLIGGGVGAPPMYLLCKRLVKQGKSVTAVLGFNSKKDVFLVDELRALGARVLVATADGSLGERGFVTDILPRDYSYFYACGPEPMLKAVYGKTKAEGELSFEERMGCGFGACMGCTCRTRYGNKRICRDGPVLKKSEVIFDD